MKKSTIKKIIGYLVISIWIIPSVFFTIKYSIDTKGLYLLILTGIILFLYGSVKAITWAFHAKKQPMKMHYQVESSDDILDRIIRGKVNPFTEEENEISEHIRAAHKKYIALSKGESTYAYMGEWMIAIHHLQDILHHRILRRNWPNTFK